MQKIAKERNGLCLSTKYINNASNLTWQCEHGHIWEAKPGQVKNKGSWCPYCCQNIKLTIEKMQELAKIKNGKCLSTIYKTNISYLKWECKKGHIWNATPNQIKNKNQWCPYCAGNRRKTIDEMQQIAESRGGKCLSKIYINNYSNIKWKCDVGHNWEATPHNIKSGHWCPVCANEIYIREEYTRKFFEKIFNSKFIKIQPNWLRNSKGNCMELDGYNKELKIAFEYNGIQHYEEVSFFNIDLKQRQIDDKLKIELCKKHEIVLIVIPYTIKLDEFQKFILDEYFKQTGIRLDIPKYDWEKFSINKDKIKEMQEIAKSRNGECLSNSYAGSTKKLTWKCNVCNYIWKSAPYHIERGTWCPKCAIKKHVITKKINKLNKIKKENNNILELINKNEV